jgi:hypothetical protein
MTLKTYSELIKNPTFEERYRYCRLIGEVGITSFGFERSLNQRFYRSAEWKHVRDTVIARDNGCDLGIADRAIYGFIRVHHLNPISVEDFRRENFTMILDPEFLVCVSLDTHNAIHFGSEKSLLLPFIERRKGDTSLWTVS